jgi:hypothetical protein
MTTTKLTLTKQTVKVLKSKTGLRAGGPSFVTADGGAGDAGAGVLLLPAAAKQA